MTPPAAASSTRRSPQAIDRSGSRFHSSSVGREGYADRAGIIGAKSSFVTDPDCTIVELLPRFETITYPRRHIGHRAESAEPAIRGRATGFARRLLATIDIALIRLGAVGSTADQCAGHRARSSPRPSRR